MSVQLQKFLLNSKVQLRRDTLQNWNLYNPILSSGEAAVVYDGKLTKLKIGDGEHPFTELKYLNGAGDEQLSGYYTKSEIDQKISEVDVREQIEDIYTKSEVDDYLDYYTTKEDFNEKIATCAKKTDVEKLDKKYIETDGFFILNRFTAYPSKMDVKEDISRDTSFTYTFENDGVPVMLYVNLLIPEVGITRSIEIKLFRTDQDYLNYLTVNGRSGVDNYTALLSEESVFKIEVDTNHQEFEPSEEYQTEFIISTKLFEELRPVKGLFIVSKDGIPVIDDMMNQSWNSYCNNKQNILSFDDGAGGSLQVSGMLFNNTFVISGTCDKNKIIPYVNGVQVPYEEETSMYHMENIPLNSPIRIMVANPTMTTYEFVTTDTVYEKYPSITDYCESLKKYVDNRLDDEITDINSIIGNINTILEDIK